MNPTKRFLIKLAVLAALIVAIQVSMYMSKGGDRKFFMIEIKDYHAVIAKNPSVIYFIDSVNTAVSPTDKDKRSISQMLGDLVPAITVAPLDHSAYNMFVYRSFLENMPKRGFHPQTVIVHINLRSFSTGWYKNAGWQFSKLRLTLDHDFLLFRAFFKPLAIFKAINLNPISEEEFQSMPVMDGDHAIGTIRDLNALWNNGYPESMYAKKFIQHYMYRLTPEHEYVQSMAAMARFMKSHGIRGIFYVSPVDVETGTGYLGPRFQERIRENTAVLKTALEQEGTELLDLSAAVPSNGFNWLLDRDPCEHVNERGRKIIAGELAKTLNSH